MTWRASAGELFRSKGAKVTRRELYAAAGSFTFVGILVACLWPFHSPTNDVLWLPHGEGVRFGTYGTLMSRAIIKLTEGGRQSGFTLEVALQPKRPWDTSTILAFYDPHRPSGFALRQWNGLFLVERAPWNRENVAESHKLYMGSSFGKRGFIFLTLTSGPQGTRAYIDGALTRAVEQFRVTADDLSGRMVVANSPALNNSWCGKLKFIALYGCALTAPEVLQDCLAWRRTGRLEATDNRHPVALYLFDEHSGSVVHNRAGLSGDLYLPKRYTELHHTLLRPPWDEYSPGWGYWKDVLINIAGFAPLGFFGYAYLSLIPRARRPALVIILFGCLVSLTVEILQAYLPTRDSGMTDIFTNTSGTAIGILLYRCINLVCETLVRSRHVAVRSLGALFADSAQGRGKISFSAPRS